MYTCQIKDIRKKKIINWLDGRMNNRVLLMCLSVVKALLGIKFYSNVFQPNATRTRVTANSEQNGVALYHLFLATVQMFVMHF